MLMIQLKMFMIQLKMLTIELRKGTNRIMNERLTLVQLLGLLCVRENDAKRENSCVGENLLSKKKGEKRF